MITINTIRVNDVEYINGKIGKTPFSVKYSQEAKDLLVAASDTYNACTTFAEAQELLKITLESVKQLEAEASASNSITTILKDDLVYDEKKETYHIIHLGRISVEPVHQFFVDKMIVAADKGISPKPWLIFWVRLMRNSLFRNNKAKVERLVKYLDAKYVDQENISSLVESGYSENIAETMSTFDQISITEEGILAAFKYVDLISTKYVVEKDEDGNQNIVIKPKYERVLEVDEVTGEVTKDELALPEQAEEFLFQPPIMLSGGDAFTSHEISEDAKTAELGHTIKVGRIHSLPNGFSDVNTNDDTWGVKGLHLGGYYYVQNFGGATSYLVDCLVSPEDIGAVADMSRNTGEGAIRCKRYMVTGGHFAVSRGMYHPATYAKLLDVEWEEMKKLVIAELNSEIAKAVNVL